MGSGKLDGMRDVGRCVPETWSQLAVKGSPWPAEHGEVLACSCAAGLDAASPPLTEVKLQGLGIRRSGLILMTFRAHVRCSNSDLILCTYLLCRDRNL